MTVMCERSGNREGMRMNGGNDWPALPLAQWQDTRDTLHLLTQIAGKVRLASTPVINHWWNVSLYVTARGFTTSLMPHRDGGGFQIDFDFIAGEIVITTTAGGARSISLSSKPVAEYYAELMLALSDLGVPTEIWPVPVEIEGVIPFPEDHVHVTFDLAQARGFWLALVQAERVFTEFRAGFIGKDSPVHLFWGALDLAVTRFSGRTAPPHPGGAPNCGPEVMLEAYSHEVSSAGYWPGGGPEGIFYSYCYPEPPGYRTYPVEPAGAYFSAELGEFVLPYELVRGDAGRLPAFLQSTYEAAAICGHWDRAALER
jgi:hypothetical protein